MNAIRKKAEDPKDQTVTTPKDIELLQKIAELMEKQVNLLEHPKTKDADNAPKNNGI